MLLHTDRQTDRQSLQPESSTEFRMLAHGVCCYYEHELGGILKTAEDTHCNGTQCCSTALSTTRKTHVRHLYKGVSRVYMKKAHTAYGWGP